MENKNASNVSTKEEQGRNWTLSPSDAEEFRAYKRQKKIGEIVSAIARSASPIGAKDDAVRVTEKALRHRQAGVKLTPLRFSQTREYLLKSRARVDVIVGGNGETLPKVKAFEAKQARKMGASELTVVVAPSLASACRYSDIKRELKRVKRAGKGLCFKVWADKSYPFSTLARLARISGEVGARYFSVPYFAGCERLRYELAFGCLLEVCGVENFSDFKKMARAGTGRIVTSNVSDIYAAWLQEAEEECRLEGEKSIEKTQVTVQKEGNTEEKPQTQPKIEEKTALTAQPIVKTSDFKFM